LSELSKNIWGEGGNDKRIRRNRVNYVWIKDCYSDLIIVEAFLIQEM